MCVHKWIYNKFYFQTTRLGAQRATAVARHCPKQNNYIYNYDYRTCVLQ